ncbi:MAG: serine/threonine protein kinase, partial [Myxococcales bacterium]|nr:serine/threonine protein kinase [Myxococcales bacterium]
MDLRPGDVLDAKYRIVRLLGQGGMGAVYEAVNVQIDRRVAIKVLHTSMAASETSVQRFEREAKAAARIGSPNIVEALDFGTVSDGIRYLVMEYLEGESLRQRLAAEVALSPMTLLPIVAQILDGLADAHDKGIIHRDL